MSAADWFARLTWQEVGVAACIAFWAIVVIATLPPRRKDRTWTRY